MNHQTLTLEEENKWRYQVIHGQISSLEKYAKFMLQKVSRTFALNITILPAGLQMQVLLAYLFCRMADTLEDDASLKPEEKIRLLEQFKNIFKNPDARAENLTALTQSLPHSWNDSSRWDQLLTYHSKAVFDLYWNLPSPTAQVIARWVTEMCDGMQQFTAKGDSGSSNLIKNMGELDRYCYYVAGTVGNLLCDLFYKYSKLIGKKSKVKLEQFSVSFGLGLQLTNILKDVCEDMDRNVVFIPKDLLEEHGVTPQTLKSDENLPHLKSITRKLLVKARDHLVDALEYTCLLPRLEPRLRLFCLWPLFMALETLILVSKAERSIGTEDKIKIDRKQVKQILQETSFVCLSNFLIRKKFDARVRQLNQTIFA